MQYLAARVALIENTSGRTDEMYCLASHSIVLCM